MRREAAAGACFPLSQAATSAAPLRQFLTLTYSFSSCCKNRAPHPLFNCFDYRKYLKEILATNRFSETPNQTPRRNYASPLSTLHPQCVTSKSSRRKHAVSRPPFSANFRLTDDSSRIVDQPRVGDRQPLGWLRTTHKTAAKALKTAWTSIAGKRLPLLCLSSPEKTPSTKAAPAVIQFTSRWISPNKRATIIAA